MSGYETDEVEEITEEWTKTVSVKKKKKKMSNPITNSSSTSSVSLKPIVKVCIIQIYPWHSVCRLWMSCVAAPENTVKFYSKPNQTQTQSQAQTKRIAFCRQSKVKVEDGNKQQTTIASASNYRHRRENVKAPFISKQTFHKIKIKIQMYTFLVLLRREKRHFPL